MILKIDRIMKESSESLRNMSFVTLFILYQFSAVKLPFVRDSDSLSVSANIWTDNYSLHRSLHMSYLPQFLLHIISQRSACGSQRERSLGDV